MASFHLSPYPSFDKFIHLQCPVPSEDQVKLIEDFRNQLKFNELYRKHIDWANNQQLFRFLIARNFNISDSLALINEALEWREKRKPSEVDQREGWQDFISKESETGKIYCPGFDRWGRSVIVFNNTVQNTPNSEDHLTFLAWNLEFAVKLMEQKDESIEAIDKYLIFIHLDKFSFFNMPPFVEIMETILMVSKTFPERLGHCVCYHPPYIFKAFFDSVKGFLDSKTVGKVLFIYGDVSDGSVNDQLLCDTIGNNWKILTGAEQKVLKPMSSPGYDHDIYWPIVLERQRSLGNRFV